MIESSLLAQIVGGRRGNNRQPLPLPRGRARRPPSGVGLAKPDICVRDRLILAEVVAAPIAFRRARALGEVTAEPA